MKIAIYSYTKWALGQIHRAIAKYHNSSLIFMKNIAKYTT